MNELDKVIEGLQVIDAYFRESFNAMDETLACELFRKWSNAAEDAIALLKKQKPIKPNRLLNEKVVSYDNVVYQYSCGNCSTLLRNSWKACPLCGKVVKWDD